MENKRRIGSCYEDQAAACLESKGYRIVERNYRCKAGEIDLIAAGEGYLIFTEVKGRKNSRYGSPAEAVNAAKQRTIRRVALWYLMQHKLPENTPCRFDVISICGEEVWHIPNAF